MVAPLFTPSPLAKDLPHNPVPCAVSIHEHFSPATLVLEAIVSDRISDTGRLSWLTCSDLACIAEAYAQATSYLPMDTDLRDADVDDLELLSGLAVTEQAVA